MAQIVGGVVGSGVGGSIGALGAFGGPIGAIVGTVGGYYLDQSGILDWWYPYKILKKMVTPDPVQGPRVNDLRVTMSSEGFPRNFVVGPNARVNASLRWSTSLREHKKQTGGKGGTSAEYVEYQYFMDAAYYLCDGPVKEVKRIWADGKTIYAKNTSINQLELDAVGNGKIVNFTSSYMYVYQRLYIDTNQDPQVEDDLDLIQPGQKVKLSNLVFNEGQIYTDAQKDWFQQEHVVWKSYKSGNASGSIGKKLIYVTVFEGTPAEYSDLTTALGGQAYFDGAVTFDIFQAVSLFNGKVAKAISVKLGGPNQMPDALIAATEGEEVPGYRGTCYVRFTDLYLADFDNRPPVIEALIDSGKGLTVGAAIKRICTKYCGIPEGLISIQSTPAYNLFDPETFSFGGMNIEGDVSPHEALAPILAAYKILPYDDEGQLTFRPRLAPLTRTLTKTAEPGPSCKVTSTADAPSILNVEFIDAEHGFQKATRRARLNDVKNSVSDTLSTGMVITGSQAMELAYSLLYDVHQSGKTYTLPLPPSQLMTKPTELVTFNGLGTTALQAAILDVDYGADGTIIAHAKEEDLEVLDQTYIIVEDEPPPALAMIGDDSFQDPVQWDVLDLAPLQDDHVDVAGLYFAAAGSNRSFKGALIYSSADRGVTYDEIGRIGKSAVMGVVLEKSGDYSGNAHGFDTKSTITFELLNEDMADGVESFAIESVLAGRSTWHCAGEVFGAADVDLVAKNTYQMSNMIRGLRGTEENVDDLQPGDVITLLARTSLHFQRLNPVALKTERLYKVIGPGGRLELVQPRAVKPSGGTLRPLSVFMVEGKRNSVGDLTVTWLPRATEIGRWDQGRRQLGQERYVVAIPERQQLVTDERSWGYSAAQQAADGRVLFDPVTVTITRVHDVVGKGRGRTVTV